MVVTLKESYADGFAGLRGMPNFLNEIGRRERPAHARIRGRPRPAGPEERRFKVPHRFQARRAAWTMDRGSRGRADVGSVRPESYRLAR